MSQLGDRRLRLRRLILRNNQLQMMVLAPLPYLEELDLSRNRLGIINQPLPFRALRLLDLSHNQIAAITVPLPDTLRTLRLTGNPLSRAALAQVRRALPELQEFDADDFAADAAGNSARGALENSVWAPSRAEAPTATAGPAASAMHPHVQQQTQQYSQLQS